LKIFWKKHEKVSAMLPSATPQYLHEARKEAILKKFLEGLESVRKNPGMYIGSIAIVPLMLVITLLVFTLIHIAPGDPFTMMFGTDTGGVEEEKLLREIYIKKWGLDKPIWEQYFYWLFNAVQGDLGYSFMTGRNVFELITERIPLTIELGALSLLVSLIIGILIPVHEITVSCFYSQEKL
jgi:ABC-type microcin C transport system permease subunit YejB